MVLNVEHGKIIVGRVNSGTKNCRVCIELNLYKTTLNFTKHYLLILTANAFQILKLQKRLLTSNHKSLSKDIHFVLAIADGEAYCSFGHRVNVERGVKMIKTLGKECLPGMQYVAGSNLNYS